MAVAILILGFVLMAAGILLVVRRQRQGLTGAGVPTTVILVGGFVLAIAAARAVHGV